MGSGAPIGPIRNRPSTSDHDWLGCWHLIWWWSGALATLRSESPPSRTRVEWPGSAAAFLGVLDALAQDWEGALSALDEIDLNRPVAYPWPDPRPLGEMLAWVNLELMKNVAEIGCVRHLFEASRRPAIALQLPPTP